MRNDYRELIKNGKTIITAHSGCEGTAANSLEHIRTAIASGAEIMEVDVRSNGTFLYLGHDIPENTENAVRLEECFALVAAQENLCMNLDVKTEGLIPDVMRLASKYDLCERIIFTGACNSDRALANSLGAEMWRSMWSGEQIEDGIKANHEDGSPALNVYFKMITEKYDKDLKTDGKGFSAWTVDNEDDIIRFLKMGILNITTRKPLLALKYRKEIQNL